jgi:hypothetical protein
MRDFTGIPYANIPHPNAPDFSSRLRNAMGIVDAWARDVSQAVALIQKGQVPQGQGVTLGSSSLTTEEDAFLRTGDGFVDLTTDQTINGVKDFETGLSVGLFANVTLNVGSLFGVDGIKTIFTAAPAGIADISQWVGNAGTTVASVSSTGGFVADTMSFANGGTIGANTFDATGVLDALWIKDTGTGNVGSITWPAIGAGASIQLPVTGTILTNLNSVSVAAKTLLHDTVVRCDTGTGVTFADNSSTTKNMRFDLSGITAANVRNQKFQDTAGSVVLVGNAASATGVLGTIALTAQTNSLAAQTMLTGNASSAGLYRLAWYLKTTTAGSGGDVVKATVAWNDGAAQSMDVPMMNATAIVNNLDLGTLNAFVQGSVVVKAAASQNITFTTTVTKAGSPQYLVDCRIVALG